MAKQKPHSSKILDVVDMRTSVDMSVKLSIQLIATAMGMLTVEGALFVFAMTYRQLTWLFFVFGFLAAASFVLSIIFSGKAISIARDNGYEGNWDLACSKDLFNKQALGGLAGLIFLVFTLMFGLLAPAKSDINSIEIVRLQSDIDSLRSSVMSLQQRDATLIKQGEVINEIQKDIAKLSKKKTTGTPAK